MQAKKEKTASEIMKDYKLRDQEDVKFWRGLDKCG